MPRRSFELPYANEPLGETISEAHRRMWENHVAAIQYVVARCDEEIDRLADQIQTKTQQGRADA